MLKDYIIAASLSLILHTIIFNDNGNKMNWWIKMEAKKLISLI